MPFALALTVVLGLLAVVQLALALGAPLGAVAWGGRHRVLPTRLRVGSAASIIVYALIAAILWDRVGAIDWFPAAFSTVAAWVISAFFATGIVMNAASRSRPKRLTMTPASIILTAMSFLIALGYGGLAEAA